MARLGRGHSLTELRMVAPGRQPARERGPTSAAKGRVLPATRARKRSPDSDEIAGRAGTRGQAGETPSRHRGRVQNCCPTRLWGNKWVSFYTTECAVTCPVAVDDWLTRRARKGSALGKGWPGLRGTSGPGMAEGLWLVPQGPGGAGHRRAPDGSCPAGGGVGSGRPPLPSPGGGTEAAAAAPTRTAPGTVLASGA